jgi:DNA-directed RNA polymerase specialized sigma subunit
MTEVTQADLRRVEGKLDRIWSVIAPMVTKKTTLREIAALTGVSASTVCRKRKKAAALNTFQGLRG